MRGGVWRDSTEVAVTTGRGVSRRYGVVWPMHQRSSWVRGYGRKGWIVVERRWYVLRDVSRSGGCRVTARVSQSRVRAYLTRRVGYVVDEIVAVGIRERHGVLGGEYEGLWRTHSTSLMIYYTQVKAEAYGATMPVA
ncbi:hypothetical protein L226DRAFT_269687 [Lentinus tigrinus ALCF2SS1-7]|uniref:uncharacterized protein n=1 Tax=Lentinus tigrinus ALCF2SS1-7 TaxID=1328758 RepID=UPI001166287A|nr:hypothetical protein L226DRAFT_269687 [Lentinus tigrinus ALCF2SS1-7]